MVLLINNIVDNLEVPISYFNMIMPNGNSTGTVVFKFSENITEDILENLLDFECTDCNIVIKTENGVSSIYVDAVEFTTLTENNLIISGEHIRWA